MVEALTSCLIICVLISIIVPGIVAGRSTARRVQCLNNMRQVSLGLQNYVQQHDTLPPGVVNPTGPIRNYREEIHRGWLVQILAFMEQAGMAAMVDADESVYSQAHAGIRGTRMGTLSCPADPRTALMAMSPPSSNYAGCHHDVEAPIDADDRGVLFLNSAIRYEDVTDGTGNTIYFGEKPIDYPDYGWVSGTRSTLRNTGWPINGGPKLTPSSFNTPAPVVIPNGGFGSAHPGGANVGFGDGSIRFLRDSTDPAILRLLGNRADGEPIGGDSY